MKKYYLFFISILMSYALWLTSCVTDYAYSTSITIENNSSHVVKIENKTGQPSNMEEIYVILPGQYVSYSITNESDTYLPLDLSVPLSVKVTFDDRFSVEHDIGNKPPVPNNLCQGKNYRLISREKYKECYSFTVTEADYEYAVSAGDIIGGNLDVHATNISDIPCACQQ